MEENSNCILLEMQIQSQVSLSKNKKAATPVRGKYKWGKIALT
jgi:hypothetical protein